MNSPRMVSLRFLIPFFFALSILSAQSSREEPVLELGAPMPLETRMEEVMKDGIPSTYLKITGRDFLCQWYGLDSSWSLGSNSERTASLEFVNRSILRLKMELSLYRPNEKLKDLGPNSLSNYQAMCEQKLGKLGEVKLLNPGSIKPPLGSVPFLNGSYREFYFSLTRIKDNGEQDLVRIIDVLTVTENGLICVLRFTGPAAIIERLKSTIPSELVNFYAP